MKNLVYVANWKMAQPFNKAIEFVQKNKDELAELGQSNDIVICPSFVALYPLIQELQNTRLKIGAQDCSPFATGAYTGQVSATSLKEVGCFYCIIGHSERREYNHETNEEVAKKLDLLLKNNLQPIICIGESKSEFEDGLAKQVLTEHLKRIFHSFGGIKFKKTIYIAYEPIWAIGTGIIPEKEYLKEILGWLQKYCTNKNPTLDIRVLYGGSVNPANITMLKSIETVQGFLIGSASLDFQNLKKIVI